MTDEGRAAAEKIKTPPWEEITEDADQDQVNLRAALGQLYGAVVQSVYAATGEQQQRVVAILKKPAARSTPCWLNRSRHQRPLSR